VAARHMNKSACGGSLTSKDCRRDGKHQVSVIVGHVCHYHCHHCVVVSVVVKGSLGDSLCRCLSMSIKVNVWWWWWWWCNGEECYWVIGYWVVVDNSHGIVVGSWLMKF